jgi:hypothetical protein
VKTPPGYVKNVAKWMVIAMLCILPGGLLIITAPMILKHVRKLGVVVSIITIETTRESDKLA